MITSILRYSTLLILFTSITYAQIPNFSFENWTGQTPDGWVTSNAPPVYTNVTASINSYSGSLAVRGEVVDLLVRAVPPVLQVGSHGEGFAYTQRPTAITGWYQFYPTGGDIFIINTGIVNPGSYFILDNLEFSGATRIAEGITEHPTDFRLEQNFPNPFNPSTTIDFSLPARAQTRLVVYNTLGQEVAVLVNGELESGMHSVRFDPTGLPSGIYFYRLTAGKNMHTGEMNLLK